MKNLKKIMFFAITVFTLTMATSCSSDDSKDEDENSTTTDFIKFKYNDKSYSFEPSVLTSLSVNILGSSGEGNTYKRVSLWLPLNASVGTHPIVYNLSELETTYQATFFYDTEFSNANATSGTVNITKATAERIEGTFSFSGTQNDKTFTVTEGSFSVER